MLTWDDIWKSFRPVLPKVAAVTSELGGVLVGGTALAIHLEHRVSFDIDVQVMVDFDSRELGGDLTRELDAYVEATATNYVHCLIDNIKVEVWKSRHHQVPIEDGPVVAGMQIASLRDLFALKLGAIVDRRQFRDFYDIATLTRQVMTLADGLRSYAYRYGKLLTLDELDDVLRALKCPSEYIAPDPYFDHSREQVLTEIRSAADEVLSWMAAREGTHDSMGDPPDSPRLPPPVQ